MVEVGQLCALPPGLRTKSDQGCFVENLLGGQEAVHDGAVDGQEAVHDGAGLPTNKKNGVAGETGLWTLHSKVTAVIKVILTLTLPGDFPSQ